MTFQTGLCIQAVDSEECAVAGMVISLQAWAAAGRDRIMRVHGAVTYSIVDIEGRGENSSAVIDNFPEGQSTLGDILLCDSRL